MSKYRRYNEDFKREAVSLGDRLGNDAEAARQLGITPCSIFQWRKKVTPKDISNKGKGFQAEVERLRQENADLKKVNEILKRAAAFFSQDHLK